MFTLLLIDNVLFCYISEKMKDRTMLKDGSKYITFIKRRLFSPVLLKTVSLLIVLTFFAMLSLQIEEIKGNCYINNYIITTWLLYNCDIN